MQICTDNNELHILDAGTGLFPLSQTLLGALPVTANVLITHSHWDHIQGLPFFMPNFISGNTLRLHGAYDPVSGNGCLLYTSPSPRDRQKSRMPSSA